jgi:GNAT superfamily N-acetyltransferase
MTSLNNPTQTRPNTLQFYFDQAWLNNICTKNLATERLMLKHFLKHHQQSVPQKNDSIAWIKQAQRPVGALRLVALESLRKDDLEQDTQQDEDNPNNTTKPMVFWLRGLFIEPSARLQGLASQLLNFATQAQLAQRQTAPLQIFAFAPPHLQSFYTQNGYQPYPPSHLPEPLKTRYATAQQQGKTWLCLASIKGHLY